MIETNAKWWNNGTVNKRSVLKPDDTFVLGRMPYKRSPHSEETKLSISNSLKGSVPWNKGKTKVYKDETRQKMSESAKKRVALGILPDNTGRPSWNSGKTAEEDNRIDAYAKKQRGQKRIGNYFSTTHWKGEGNPWYGKPRSGKLNPRYVEHRHSREYKDFYNTVVWETEKTYAKYKNEINPNDYPRTICGVPGGYQLDHIKSIDFGWKNGLSTKELSCKENLQMLLWEENRKKSNK